MQLKHAENNILAIGDLHAPFIHQDALAFIRAVCKIYGNPTQVVSLGDEIDACAISRYAHDPDGMSPGDEYRAALKMLEPWYREFPKVKVCTSNHTNRPYRRAFEAGLPRAFLKEYRQLLKAPSGWTWADFWDVDAIRFVHGEGFSGPSAHRTAAVTTMMSTVIGHVHSHAGVQYLATQDREIWGMNVGCLVDPTTYAFRYASNAKSKVTLGVGVIRNGYPIFVPMKVDSKCRWIGIV